MVTTQLNMVRLGDKSLILRGGSPRPIQNYITTAPDGINWIKIGDVSISDKYIRKTNEKIKPSGVAMSRVVNPGDLILSNSMSFGRPYILQISGCIHDGWLVIQNYQDTFEPEYLLYALGSEFVKKQYIAMAAGSSVQNLNKEKVSDVVLWAPQKTEQKQILQALSDIDSLIDNTEKLIEKKKTIKQGVMQELLTGKRRLPGFAGEWENMTIGQHGYLQKGSINPQTQPNDYFTEYSMPAFDDGQVPSQTLGKDMHSNRTVIRGKTLLFNKLNVRQQRIWLIDQCENNAICSAEFLPYCSTEIDLKLLSQILYTDKVTEDFIGMSTGTSNSQKRITPKAFLDYTIYLPKDMEEQKALSKVFDDMDKEIEALEIQLEKYHSLKIGMMSKLLTGEIRLVE